MNKVKHFYKKVELFYNFFELFKNYKMGGKFRRQFIPIFNPIYSQSNIEKGLNK